MSRFKKREDHEHSDSFGKEPCSPPLSDRDAFCPAGMQTVPAVASWWPESSALCKESFVLAPVPRLHPVFRPGSPALPEVYHMMASGCCSPSYPPRNPFPEHTLALRKASAWLLFSRKCTRRRPGLGAGRASPEISSNSRRRWAPSASSAYRF